MSMERQYMNPLKCKKNSEKTYRVKVGEQSRWLAKYILEKPIVSSSVISPKIYISKHAVAEFTHTSNGKPVKSCSLPLGTHELLKRDNSNPECEEVQRERDIEDEITSRKLTCISIKVASDFSYCVNNHFFPFISLIIKSRDMKVKKKRTSGQEADIASYSTKWVPKKQIQASEIDP